MSDLYGDDIVLWCERQADALRRRAANEVDWDNVAEEIEGVAANQKREVRSRLRVICEHLLKWRHLREREHQGQSWRHTLSEQRRELEGLFEDSPSLRGFAGEVLQRSFVNARQDVERETDLGVPEDVSPWTLEEVLSLDFLPAGAADTDDPHRL
jgi:hypothetical protein